MKPLREWIELLFDNDPPQKLLFRVDGGSVEGLSYGHLVRCMILSDVLRNLYGGDHLFLMRHYEDGVHYAVQSGKSVSSIPRDAEVDVEKAALFKVVERFRPDWMVIDLPYPNLDTSFLPELRFKGVKIVFIDDSRFISPQVDVLLNSSVLAVERTRRINKITRYLLGPEYFIFDEPMKEVHARKSRKSEFNVVLTFGGSDPTDLTRKALEALLERSWPGVVFHTILGPGYKAVGAVNALTRGRESTFRCLVNPANIIHVFKKCDFAVCAGGRTMYELLHLRKPFLPIASIGHEAEAVFEFIKQGLIPVGMPKWDRREFLTNIKRLCGGLLA